MKVLLFSYFFCPFTVLKKVTAETASFSYPQRPNVQHSIDSNYIKQTNLPLLLIQAFSHAKAFRASSATAALTRLVMGEPIAASIALHCADMPCLANIAAPLLAFLGPKQKHLGNHSNNYGDRATLFLNTTISTHPKSPWQAAILSVIWHQFQHPFLSCSFSINGCILLCHNIFWGC